MSLYSYRPPSPDEETISEDTDNDSEIEYLVAIVVIAVILILILIVLTVICHSHKKLQSEVANEGVKEMRNGLLVSIPIGIYDNSDDPTVSIRFPNIPVERDAKNMKDLADFLQYEYLTIDGKLNWTESEVTDFITNKVGEEYFDADGNPKYDGLIVSFSGHGVRDHIVTSDGQLIDRTSIHRSVSNKFPEIREFPRIFIFDACDGSGDRTKSVSSSATVASKETVHSDSEMDDYKSEDEMVEDENTRQQTETEKGMKLEDVQKDDEWTTHTKNPDYNLAVVHASNSGFVAKMHSAEHIGSYLSYFFAKQVKRNVQSGNTQGLGEIMKDIERALHDKGKQLIRTEFFTGMRKLRIEKNVLG